MSWSFYEGQIISHMWCGNGAQAGAAVEAGNLEWNKVIQPNGTVRFGFNGTHGGSNAAPDDFTITGVTCSPVGEQPY